jgi:transposase
MMSLPPRNRQGSLFDVPVLAGGLFANPADRFRIFRHTVMPALWAQREALAQLYCQENGRPGLEPVLMTAVSLLQFMEKAPDRKAEEYVRLHLGWKYALDLELGYEGFDHSSLGKFRDRLLEGGAERIGFDALLVGLRQAGLVKKHSRQRLDSTHVLGAVARMSRLEMVRETIRLFLEHVQRVGAQQRLPGWAQWHERYIDSEIPWHRLSVESLAEKFQQAGDDALALIRWLRQESAAVWDHERAVLLERVFLEQYELDTGAPVRRKSEESGAVKNPHDPNVQWAAKDLAKTKQWEGYKVQLAETVPPTDTPKDKGDPTEQFIVEVVTTEAIASDLAGMQQVLQSEAQHHDDRPAELYVDAAYVTDDTLAQAKSEGRELIGPPRPCGNAPGNGFSAAQFNVDTTKRTAICPAGHLSRQCSLIHDAYNSTVFLRFEWAGLCDLCPLQKQCTKSRTGRRLLVVGVHHDLLQERRQQMESDEFKKLLRRRNGIEGTISEFTRGGGRRTRYRGQRKTALGNYMQAAAINAKRWIRLQAWQHERETARNAA